MTYEFNQLVIELKQKGCVCCFKSDAFTGSTQDKKAAQEKERESRIADAEVENLQGARHQEGLILAQMLAQKQLQIREISSDGHCMYRAVEDQLGQRSKVNTCLQSE